MLEAVDFGGPSLLLTNRHENAGQMLGIRHCKEHGVMKDRY